MAMWTTMKRVSRYGLVGFFRNGFVSLSAVLIMTITLFVVATLMGTAAALQSVLDDLTNKVDITVYFMPAATGQQVSDMKERLQNLPQVASVSYESPQQALEQFKERHKSSQIELQALDLLNTNPFGAALSIRAKNTAQYEGVAKYIEEQQTGDPGLASVIHNINFYQNKTAIDRLTSIIEISERFGIAVAVFLGIATLLIAFNTIRLAIYTSREEIGVMNLVGASHWYVRGPFVIAGILYGVASAIIVLVVLYPLTAWLGPASEQFFGVFNVYDYYMSEFTTIFFVLMGAGVSLGALSSWLAVRRYLYS